MTDKILDQSELALIAGPIQLPEPAWSFADDWLSEEIYTPDEIVAAIVAVPNTLLTHEAVPTWDAWNARWQVNDHYIDFDIQACPIDVDNPLRPGLTMYWGGSKFATRCTVEEIVQVWQTIQRHCPAVWLHNTDCRMYSPESFAEAFANGTLNVRRRSAP